jgi:hypothetical protein
MMRPHLLQTNMLCRSAMCRKPSSNPVHKPCSAELLGCPLCRGQAARPINSSFEAARAFALSAERAQQLPASPLTAPAKTPTRKAQVTSAHHCPCSSGNAVTLAV